MEEPFGLSLSIQTGATAVPVLAFEADKLGEWSGAIATDKVTGFESWLEVSAALAKKRPPAEEAGQAFDKAISKNLLYQSLKLYFLNGGGHCYVAPVDKLEALVPALDDVTLLVQAGSLLKKFQDAVSKLCKTGNTYFAIFDSSNTELTTDSVPTEAKNFGVTSPAFAAVYYPWLTVDGVVNDSTQPAQPVPIPPSGAVAGVYARVDRERGVWKAPANVEIVGAQPLYKVSDAVDAKCNVPDKGGKSINVIRAFRGTGPLIWGARTLQSDQDTWKYVPVRRLFNAVEKDVKTAMSTALFEPNSAPTWERVRGSVDHYLHGLWRDGALQGDTPAQAYYVQIGLGTTMTQEDITNGRMIVKVGLAAVRPAEFIVLQLTQDVVPA
ncbi:phage tail sheath family protein [Burkholderia stagnalis]|uniref:phage tail sheath family protein n=1 Tax=Burkholderia stagnalis TaxID=1503054 RepID=UPI0021AB6774|nr:phage tail sheath C-terminal domain-containing protein [Burkholderia stagnalis]